MRNKMCIRDSSKYVLKKSARVLAHHDKPLGSCGDLLEDISLIGIRLTKNRMQSCHNRHSEMLEQLQNMAAGLSPIDPVFVPVSYTHLDVYKRQLQGLLFPFGVRVAEAIVAPPAIDAANRPCLLYTSRCV